MHAPDPVVGEPMAEEGAVPAIVLDHEQAHEKAGSRNDQKQSDPVAEIERGPHRDPQQHKRTCGDDKLDDGARTARLAVGSKASRPVECGCGGVGWNRFSIRSH